jgi:TrmH family RNA methyltransferase
MLSINEVKHINSLKIKKYRNKYSEFIAEGRKVITELIQNGFFCKKIYIANDEILDIPNHISVQNITLNELKKISNQTHPSSALAIFEIPIPKIIEEYNNWVIALDNIQDPGNLGTIIRIADWFGIKHIVCSQDCVDAYNPKTVQASMASIANVNVLETDLKQFFDEHKTFEVHAAMLAGTNIQEYKFPKKGILLIGNEGKGINDGLLPYVQQQITIPKLGKAESLNAAIATSIIVAHIKLS